METSSHPAELTIVPPVASVPIVALDVSTLAEAMALLEKLPDASFFKVGLQLFTGAGADAVRALKERGHRVFLDLKLHDIPNTVAGAVRSAAALRVDLLTVHAVGGAAMLEAAVAAAAEAAVPPRIFAVTVLTSLSSPELGAAWGRDRVDTREEVARLARLAAAAGVAGVVASLREVEAIRAATRADFAVLTPGIRLSGDGWDDQARVGTPGEAAELGVDYVVLGRSVTGAPDPAEAYRRVLRDLTGSGGGG